MSDSMELERAEDSLALTPEEQALAEEYAALARENNPDRARFLEGTTDGLEPSDESSW